MLRREFIQSAAGAAGAALFGVPDRSAARQSAAKRPNLLYIFCDDLGYGDLGCFGNPVIRTPRLDALAAGGMRLTDCYSSSPVCSPSRAGLMTGRTPNRSGILDWIPDKSGIFLKEDELTVAKVLKSAGYATCHAGKWHLISNWDGSEPTPGDHGFDHWFSTQNNAIPSHHNPTNFIRNGNPVGPLEGYSSTIIVDEAVDFIRRAKDRPEPFAVFVWFHSPHEPIASAKEFMDWYPNVRDETKAQYFGNVSQMDYEAGRLLDSLDEMGLRESTFVMFSSDNGPETLQRYRGSERSHGSPGPLRGMKLHMHEGGIRVPGIIRWPGNTGPGEVCHEPVSGVDVLPTFAEIAGVSVPSARKIDGASMLPIFQGRRMERSTPLYWQYNRALSNVKTAVREGAWKLLVDAELGSAELYNLEDDWRETKNLAYGEPARTRDMLARLRAMHADVNEGL